MENNSVDSFIVEKIIKQQSWGASYSIFKARPSASNNLITCKGAFVDAKEGEKVYLLGKYREDDGEPYYQFSERSGVTLKNRADAIKYATLVFGIEESLAKKWLLNKGAYTFSALNSHSDFESVVRGLPEKDKATVIDSLQERFGLHLEIKKILSEGFNPSQVISELEEYGLDWIEAFTRNPYVLVKKNAFAFYKADKLARTKHNFEQDDPRRLEAGIRYALSRLSSQGNTLVETSRIYRNLPKDDFNIGAIEDWLVDQGAFEVVEKNGRDFIVDHNLNELESEVAVLLANRLANQPAVDFNQVAQTVSPLVNPSDEQKMAIIQGLTRSLSIITGGAGVGKTFTAENIIDSIRKINGAKTRVALLAPTGKAVEVLNEYLNENNVDRTNITVETVHRAVGWGKKSKGTPSIDADVVVVDEYGMVGLNLTASLLKATPKKTRLIIMGDPGQLGSIDAGNVLKDCINSEKIPVSKLTKVRRTKEGSLISVVANKINDGEPIDVDELTMDKDVSFIDCTDDYDIASTMDHLMGQGLNDFNIFTNDISVITPTKQHSLGVEQLNQKIKRIVNGVERSYQIGDSFFSRGDKVMQNTPNQYMDVVNGEEGIVSDISTRNGKKLTVSFGKKKVEYTERNISELDHSYAITIHKSQGSQYECVIIPLSSLQHSKMLNRQLLYTALTRAKGKVIIVGNNQALTDAVNNTFMYERNTELKNKIISAVEMRSNLKSSEDFLMQFKDGKITFNYSKESGKSVDKNIKKNTMKVQ